MEILGNTLRFLLPSGAVSSKRVSSEASPKRALCAMASEDVLFGVDARQSEVRETGVADSIAKIIKEVQMKENQDATSNAKGAVLGEVAGGAKNAMPGNATSGAKNAMPGNAASGAKGTVLGNLTREMLERGRKSRVVMGAVAGMLGLAGIGVGTIGFDAANALSITVDGSTSVTKSFQMTPGSSNTSGNVSVSVASSDAAGGYTLSMTGPNSAKTLVGKSNNSNVLSPITGTTWTSPASFGDDTWGILSSKLCTGSTADTCAANTAYKPAPGTGTQIIDVTTSANASAATYALAAGAKVSATKAPDTYTGTITMTLTANATPYSIGYVDPLANWPTATAGSTTNSSVTLSPLTPTKDGYTFVGWCSVSTTNETCSGTTYQPGATYSLSNGAVTNLYAMWKPQLCAGYSTMQNVSSWSSELSTSGTTKTVCDERDGNKYLVGKLADGKIWMLDNLAFDGTSGDGTSYITMDSSNTNLPSGTTKKWTSSVAWASGTSSTYTAPLLQNNSNQSNASNSGISGVDTSSWKYGVHYNYCAATVEQSGICVRSLSGTKGSTVATQSVCPAGWRLPTSASSGEFQALYTAYSSNYANFVTAFRLPLSGGVSNGSLSSGGSYGGFWSSTYYGTTNMYLLYFNTSNVNPLGGNNRDGGFPVRCIAQ